MKREVRVGVLASGRGSNFEALWRAQEAGELGARLAVLVCDRADAPVLQLARRLGVAAQCIDPGTRRARLPEAVESEIVRALRDQRVDLVCLAGFMRIVGRPLLTAFPDAVLNIHPSLLPSFPGLAAPRQALEHGVKVTGCTVHFVDAGVDSGPIVAQASVPVRADDDEASLAARILEQEHQIYARAVRLWADGRLLVHGRRASVHEPSPSGHGSNLEA